MENNTVLQNTKYCLKCGKQCNENAVICVGCGWDFKANTNKIEASQKQTGSQISIFLILASVLYGFVDLLLNGLSIFYEMYRYDFLSVWYEVRINIIPLSLDLLFIAYPIIVLKNRNYGRFTQIVLSLFFIYMIIINIILNRYIIGALVDFFN